MRLLSSLRVGILHPLLLGILAMVILGATGGFVTRLTVSDGLEQYSGLARAAAEDGLLRAQIGCFDSPLVRPLAQRFRVVQVRVLDTHKRTNQDESDARRMPPRGGRSRTESNDSPFPSLVSVPFDRNGEQFEVLVRAYSFFSLPTGTIVVTNTFISILTSAMLARDEAPGWPSPFA